MKTEEEIREEIVRVAAIGDPEIQKRFEGDPYLEHLHSALRIVRTSRIETLKWVLGEDK